MSAADGSGSRAGAEPQTTRTEVVVEEDTRGDSVAPEGAMESPARSEGEPSAAFESPLGAQSVEMGHSPSTQREPRGSSASAVLHTPTIPSAVSGGALAAKPDASASKANTAARDLEREDKREGATQGGSTRDGVQEPAVDGTVERDTRTGPDGDADEAAEKPATNVDATDPKDSPAPGGAEASSAAPAGGTAADVAERDTCVDEDRGGEPAPQPTRRPGGLDRNWGSITTDEDAQPENAERRVSENPGDAHERAPQATEREEPANMARERDTTRGAATGGSGLRPGHLAEDNPDEFARRMKASVGHIPPWLQARMDAAASSKGKGAGKGASIRARLQAQNDPEIDAFLNTWVDSRGGGRRDSREAPRGGGRRRRRNGATKGKGKGNLGEKGAADVAPLTLAEPLAEPLRVETVPGTAPTVGVEANSPDATA